MNIKLTAKTRDDQGRGASRRLRRNGEVPAIIYGQGQKVTNLSLDHNTIFHAIKKPNFHTSILDIEINGKAEKALLRDFQMHAFRPQVLHLDFQRIKDSDEINIRVPLHFINEDISHAVKMQGAHITKVITEVEIRAKASAIPHSIDVDLKDLAAGQSIHLSSLALPQNVVLTALLRGDDAAVAIAAGIAEEVADEAGTENVSAADVPTIAGEKVAKEATEDKK
jgi:large subunit ribosomal protein L25